MRFRLQEAETVLWHPATQRALQRVGRCNWPNRLCARLVRQIPYRSFLPRLSIFNKTRKTIVWRLQNNIPFARFLNYSSPERDCQRTIRTRNSKPNGDAYPTWQYQGQLGFLI